MNIRFGEQTPQQYHQQAQQHLKQYQDRMSGFYNGGMSRDVALEALLDSVAALGNGVNAQQQALGQLLNRTL